MAQYNIYPAVDSFMSFPPEIRQAFAASSELQSSITTTLADDNTVVQAAVQAINDAAAAGELSFFKGQVDTSVDLDTLIESGLYSYYATNPNAPEGKTGFMIVAPGNGDRNQQVAWTLGLAPESYIRFRGSGGWSSWTRIDAGAAKPIVIPYGDMTFNPDDVTENVTHVIDENRLTVGFPPDSSTSQGRLVTTSQDGSQRIQQFWSYGGSMKHYQRFAGSGGWSSWVRKDIDAIDTSQFLTEVPALSTASGFKTLPLVLTAGNGGGTKGATSGSVSYDVELSPQIKVRRYRIQIRDCAARYGISYDNQITLSNLRMGGVIKESNFVTTADGKHNWTRWFEGDFGDLSFDYTSTLAPEMLVGGGTINGVRKTLMPFEIWIECEIPNNTPSIGLIGDSNSVGVGTSIPLHDAYLAVYGRKMGIFPVFYGHSGDTMVASMDPEHYKWNRWPHLDRPDMALNMLGSNDLGSGTTSLATMKTRADTVWSIVDDKVSRVQHAGLLKPRNTNVGNYEEIRRLWNSYLKTKPKQIREWHDLNTPVSADDENIDAQYNADGTHMNTAGHAKLGNSFFKVTTFAGGVLFNEDTRGKTASAWNPLTNSYEIVKGTTGVRDISALASGGVGQIKLSRNDNLVTLEFNRFVPNADGYFDPFYLPVGFRIKQTNYRWMIAGASGTSRSLQLYESGNTRINSALTSDSYQQSFTFETYDPWPTTLPGIPV